MGDVCNDGVDACEDDEGMCEVVWLYALYEYGFDCEYASACVCDWGCDCKFGRE